MHRSRERKRNGLRCVTIEVRNCEVDALIGKALLKPENREDPVEIANALYGLFDRELAPQQQGVTT